MGAADTILISLVALADICVLIHLWRHRARRRRSERMMRSLRAHLQREAGVHEVRVAPAPALLLQRAS